MNITRNLYVCQDCALFIANGESPENELRFMAVVKGVEDTLPSQWCLDSGENGEGDMDFSHKPCDCCKDHLAGSRFRAALVG